MKIFTKDCEMNTSIMREYPKLKSDKALADFYELSDMEKRIAEIKREAERNFLFLQIKEVIEEDYDIGTVEKIFRIYGGYSNHSFGIYTKKDGQRQTWFFRKFFRNKDLNELILEHNLLTHSREQGFERCALPIPGIDGNTYYTRKQKMENGETATFYFAVYEYIEGNPSYDWLHIKMSKESYRSVAVLLAELHNSVRNFDPEYYERAESRIDILMKEWPVTFQNWSNAYQDNGLDNEYTRYFAEHLPYFKKICKETFIPENDLSKMPICALHCDFHPGNLKYDDNGIVTGVFDFDWAKIDIRLFEFGLGMVYFFESWDAGTNGEPDIDKIVDFINVYNARLRELKGLEPIEELEKKYLYELLIMGNMYLVKWAAEYVYRDMTQPPFEFVYYMEHTVSALNWLRTHEKEVRAKAMTIQ